MLECFKKLMDVLKEGDIGRAKAEKTTTKLLAFVDGVLLCPNLASVSITSHPASVFRRGDVCSAPNVQHRFRFHHESNQEPQ